MSSLHISAMSAEARDQLIVDHMPLLHHIVNQLFVDIPGGSDREDLEGYAMIGLIGAADSFDVGRGLKFSTFAYPRIRGAVLDELRRMDFLPRGRRERVRDVEQTLQRLEQEKGVPPSPEEIAEELGITANEVDEVFLTALSAMQTSLDDGPSESLAALLSDPQSLDPVGSAEWEEMKQLLIEAIEGLPEQEKTVITAYYGEDLLLKEISEILGVTESRVSQIHSRAIYRLNRTLSTLIGSSE